MQSTPKITAYNQSSEEMDLMIIGEGEPRPWQKLGCFEIDCEESKKRIRYQCYEIYLSSKKWDNLKRIFYFNLKSHKKVCQVSGRSPNSQLREFVSLHHWRYEKDWNDDNIGNLILVHQEVHKWIHEDYHENAYIKSGGSHYGTREECILSLRLGYSEYCTSLAKKKANEEAREIEKEWLSKVIKVGKDEQEIVSLKKKIVRHESHIDLLMEKKGLLR